MSKMMDSELKSLFEKVSQFSLQGETGITRLTYSNEDQMAHRFIMDEAKKRGFEVREDAIGNIFIRLPGSEPNLPAIGTGSHVDSVPHGGQYDGVIGVLAGFYALSQYQASELKRSLELVIFRAEESSRFGFACMGSKVITGNANVDMWQKNQDSEGKTFCQVIDECGYRSQDMATCKLPDDYFNAFIEMHIEQGKVLEVENKRIGVVSGIAAPSRYRIDVFGHADHSGATPMSQRHDAMVVAADIIQSIYHAATLEATYGTVGTVGRIDVSPNSINVIPGHVQFYVDIRGIDIKSIERVIERLNASINKARIDYDMPIEVLELSHDKPVLLDEKVIQLIQDTCQEQQIPALKMMSGAGHDAMYMAGCFPTGMIFIPSKDGISHHPDEYTDFDDVLLGANLLTICLGKLANQ